VPHGRKLQVKTKKENAVAQKPISHRNVVLARLKSYWVKLISLIRHAPIMFRSIFFADRALKNKTSNKTFLSFVLFAILCMMNIGLKVKFCLKLLEMARDQKKCFARIFVSTRKQFCLDYITQLKNVLFFPYDKHWPK
jgi:hypothetical protein